MKKPTRNTGGNWTLPGVVVVRKVKNAKTGPMACSWVARSTCRQCPFTGSPCYGSSGNCGLHARRLDEQAKRSSAITLARREAACIDMLPGTIPFRGHIVGDCPTDETARIVSAAMERYMAKHDQPAYLYTHSWRTVARVSGQYQCPCFVRNGA